MKTIYASVCFLACAASASFSFAAKEQAIRPVLVDAHVNKVFAPLGFDDNDNAQIVLDGMFFDTCHRVGPVTSKVYVDLKQVVLKAQAYRYSSGWCAQANVSYSQLVNLGLLPSGEYSIVSEKSDGTMTSLGNLHVGVSTLDSADENLYAPVQSAQILKEEVKQGDQTSIRYKLKIDGVLTSSCMRYVNTLKIEHPEADNNIIEVLPIAAMDKENCAEHLIDFTDTIELPQLKEGRWLVHVRSMNGQSFNMMIDAM